MKQKLRDLRGLQITEDLVEHLSTKNAMLHLLPNLSTEVKKKKHHFLTVVFRCLVAGQVGVTLGSGRGGIRDSFCSSIL